LKKYRYPPKLEKRHKQLKTVYAVAPACVGRTGLRKARGSEESLDAEARRFDRKTTALLKVLREALYWAREGPGEDLTPRYKKRTG
jgi:hypothetical protein